VEQLRFVREKGLYATNSSEDERDADIAVRHSHAA
jgi:hypothetical protein